ncbi:MAG: GhoT/OrtT family toxin [Symbiopectobacterium sp.]|uniref:GhoT/OrtT family toxin n=1 Tax=Symbiopectobacterium sp. TaxID=2952789 RepID=UPI0039EA51C7
MSHHTIWEFIKHAYLFGAIIAMVITFLLSRDKSLLMRFLASILIGLTWPLSFPLVLLFSLL